MKSILRTLSAGTIQIPFCVLNGETCRIWRLHRNASYATDQNKHNSTDINTTGRTGLDCGWISYETEVVSRHTLSQYTDTRKTSHAGRNKSVCTSGAPRNRRRFCRAWQTQITSEKQPLAGGASRPGMAPPIPLPTPPPLLVSPPYASLIDLCFLMHAPLVFI